ncbi:hypothetical protein [Ancylobacter polymorphus]|uniref:Uncharacterized protein n=1 Tax=Ancylobacter polymorphus TaxID=223390 RepID=A0ABU0B8D4_9HYPH|nr:hypothetical protein [Ancylobacter polymorphus]
MGGDGFDRRADRLHGEDAERVGQEDKVDAGKRAGGRSDVSNRKDRNAARPAWKLSLT